MKQFVVAFAVVLLPELLAAHSEPGRHRPLATCNARFDGDVTSGPDAGFAFGGALTFSVAPSGRAHGVLLRDDGVDVEVNGEVDGTDIALYFEGMHIHGTGTTEGDFSTCSGHSGGDLFGPRAPDRGDWGIIWGS